MTAKISRQSASEHLLDGPHDLPRHAAGGVDEDVDAAARRVHARDEGADRGRVAHVHTAVRHAPGATASTAARVASSSARAHVARPHRGALARQLDADRAADAVRGARHDGDPPLEPHA